MTIELAITVEGGIVQDIVSNNPEFFKDVNVVIIDYDASENDGGSIQVEQSDGSTTPAFVSEKSITKAEIPLPIQIEEDTKE